ncbi:type IV secretory system conjugative DNA transfer family protein [Halohasta litorea]|uniref:Type IV secretory system conjugative DNA transfer family protein n=1 Tax=Halohasta litorea TaxID=869891 RepID=A0ABD6DD72_9EURY|nr:type IV secretory system conjugative DNA transfer family protein [Halohasta litorea]
MSEFAELNENPPVDMGADADDLTTYEKAKRVVSSSSKSYYRPSVSPDDYPETDVIRAVREEAPSKEQEEIGVKRVLTFAAAYERGDLDHEKMRSEMSSVEAYEAMVRLAENHIEEAYLIRAKEADSSQADSGRDSARVEQHSQAAQKPATSASTAELGEKPALTDGTGTQDSLPLSVEGDERAENRTASGATASTTVEDDNLPAKRGKFAVNFVDTEYQQTRSESGRILHMNFKQTGSDGSLYMGEDVRQLFVEDHAEDPDMNIWLGYQSRGNNPMDEVGMEKFSWFRHISMFGTTGMGKTTSQKNLINQIVRKGYGCVVIDPKGDMAIELMQEIPESRLDDVIWVEPGSIKHPDRVAAINFLEPSIPEDHPRYDREVESIVDDLQAILKAEGYWGAKMAGITKNITRAMIRSNNPYTLYDMYNVLGQEEKRWNFARSLEREGVELGDTETGSIITDIRQYSKRIAQMEADEVDPVVRRLQDWAESPISKEIVSHRNSSVSINDAVEEGKIILVRNTVSNEEVKRVVSTAIIRRVWATIQSRADEEENEADREPFFMLIDEFDDVVSEDMNVDKMLTKARSGKMSVCLACQNPAQIEEDHEGILRQIFSNTDTMATFGVRGPDDSELIAKRMGDNVDAEDIRGMPEFRILTRITYMDEGQRKLSPAVGLQTFPDYPPLRTKEEAHEAIERSLERYGVEPMANSPEETDLLISGGGLQEQTVVDFLELVWGEQLKRGAETVTVESFADRFEEALGHPIEEFPSGIGVPPEMINVHNVSLGDDEDEDPFSMDGEWEYHEDDDTNNLIAYQTEKRIHIQKPEAEVSITAEGIDAILQQDSGRNQPTESHRKTIHDGFRWFSRLGMDLSVPIQSGTGEVCDGLADLPVEQQGAPAEIAKTLEAFEEDYPEASAISSGYHINLEAETTTQRKPARTIENVVRASTEGRKAILMVEDGRSSGRGRAYHANRVENILTDPPFYREDRMHPPGTEIPDDEEPEPEPVRILYNRTDKLRIGTPGENQEKFALIPRGKEAVWVDTGKKLELYDGHGPDAEKWGEAKYSETYYGSSNAFDVWCRYDQHQREWAVYPGYGETVRFDSKKELRESYQFVRGPLYMDAMVEQLPKRDEWEVLILPDPTAIYRDPNEAHDQDNDGQKAVYELDLQFPPEEVPLVYRDGETTPLIDEDSDLLTGPCTEDVETDDTNTNEDGTADSPTEAQAMVMAGDEIQEIMDTFEQIQLEAETKQLIDGYRREYTTKELTRLDEIEGVFGAKHPGEIDLWMSVWDYWSRSYDTGIAKTNLPDATMTATGLTRAKAKDAVAIAEDFDLLVEATPADTDDPNIDEETTILRLVQPEERPDLFVESTADLKAFADREKWAEIWDVFIDTSDKIEQPFLQTVIEKTSTIEGDLQTRAVIGVGCLCGAIVEVGGEYALSDERPRDIWLTLWEKSRAELNEPLPEQKIRLGLKIELLDSDVDHEDYFESALDHNELYSPEDLAADQYVVNDPASDEGPEIIEREGPDPFDDPDDDPDGVDNTPSTEAETQAPQSPQENVGPATADVEPQEAADAATTDDTTEGEQSVASANSSSTNDAGDSDVDPDEKFDDVGPESFTENAVSTFFGGDLAEHQDATETTENTEDEDSAVDESATDVDSDTDAADSDGSYKQEVDPADVRSHYSAIEDVYGDLPIGEFAPILNADYAGWYITEDNDEYDPDLPIEGNETDSRVFDKIRKPASPKDDLSKIIQGVERTMYATTSYKTDEMMGEWTPAQYDRERGGYEYPITGNPLPGWEDIAGLMVWGDIDLADELKPQRGDLDAETQATVERTLEAYAERYADLYGSEDAIFGLDSVGGAYIMGAPTATLDIFQYFQDIKENPVGAAMVFEEFVERSNERLKEIEQEVNEEVDGAAEVIHPDWVNNPNRLYKAPLSIHTKHKAVVTPIDPTDVEYDMTELGAVDEDLIAEARQWVADLNDGTHRECVDSLVANLWPQEYKQEDGDWKSALERWVTKKRNEEAKKREKERKARENRLERVEDAEVNLTPNYVDEYRALEAISTEEVVRLYACDDWDTGLKNSHKIEFNPSWRTSSSGSSCFVNTRTDNFGDSGMGGGGYADKAMALGDPDIAYWDPSDDLEGELRGEALDALREAGYEVPLFVPDVGSDKRNGDGKHDQTPLWAKLDAAVALGVCKEDDFVEVEREDNGEKYHKLPDDVNAELFGILRNEYGYTVSETKGEDESESADNSTDPSGAENAGGVGLGVVTGDDSVGESTGDRDVDGGDDADDEDELTRFLTYEEPDLDNPAIDVDTDAVHQFVSEFAVVHEGDDPSIGIKKDTLFLAFANWSKLNGIELNKLSGNKATQPKKTKLKTILDSLYNINDGKVNSDEGRFRGFRSIELSEYGEELLTTDLE